MKRTILAAGIVILLLGLFMAPSAYSVSAREPKILEFDTMIGVPKAYTGSTNPIRGINGGGLPWFINGASGELSAGGKLEVKVSGLVFDPSDPTVVARGLANMNTVTSFKAVVSCQTVDASGSAVVVNVSTDAFPATTGLATAGGGNAKIEARLSLPKPCIAPIVFITSPGGAWFAATGN